MFDATMATRAHTGLSVTTGRRGFPADVLWLSFLALYLTPWITSAPPVRNWSASLAGTAVFLLLYWHSYRAPPRRLAWHAAAIAAIGFALALFGGVWNVFNVLAASVAARIEPRSRALVSVVALQLALFAFAETSRLPPVAWVSGVYFGILAAGTTMLLSDLDRRNRELRAAEGEVRRLGAAAERDRIARDLHDLLGRTLTAMAIKANLARRLAERDPARAAREIGEVADAARDALAEVRAAVGGIAAPSLAEEAERARAVLADAGVEATVRLARTLLPSSTEAALAMVLREAVTNVVRHAAARCCAVDGSPLPGGGYRLRIADDGRGGATEGFGTAGMRRRLADVGGTLRLDSGSAGTCVSADMPV